MSSISAYPRRHLHWVPSAHDEQLWRHLNDLADSGLFKLYVRNQFSALVLNQNTRTKLEQKADKKTWKCNAPAGVRELLGLGPPYYFGIVPKSESGATKYDVEWAQLEDPMGFKAKWGPTTAGNDDLKIVLWG